MAYLEHIRVGYAGAKHDFVKRAPDASCTTGGFYSSPAAGATVSTDKKLEIAWNPSCLEPKDNKVDIYLYAPSAESPIVHVWGNVPANTGKFVTELKPKWWKSTPTVDLQLRIVESGSEVFMASLPAGPLFTASYTAPASGTPANADTTKPDGLITNVGAIKSGLAPGKVAAAVIMPLLCVIALGSFFWIKRSRAKGKEDRRRWSEAVDKRMSTISTDWKSITPGGAKEAIRQSMAGNRMSGFAFGNIRPNSTAEVSHFAARGNGGIFRRDDAYVDPDAPHMAQLRPGLRASALGGERVSRVSFANDPRPKSGKYNEKNMYDHPLPPMPEMSHEQAEGPLTLTAEDIRARIHGQETEARPSVDEVMPALSLMRTGGEDPNTQNDDYLLWEAPKTPNPAGNFYQHQPHPPIPAPTQDRSPVGTMPMQAMPANVMSPDEMLRAYAARSQSPAVGGPAVPQATAKYNGGGMRTLYSPPSSSNGGSNVMGGIGVAGRGLARYDEDDAPYGTAQ